MVYIEYLSSNTAFRKMQIVEVSFWHKVMLRYAEHFPFLIFKIDTFFNAWSLKPHGLQIFVGLMYSGQFNSLCIFGFF